MTTPTYRRAEKRSIPPLVGQARAVSEARGCRLNRRLFIPSTRAAQTSLAFWTCAIITTISALVSAGFSIVGLFGPSRGDIFERYAASRSIALPTAVLCCIGFRSHEAIAALAFVMTLVHVWTAPVEQENWRAF